jgi:hypothetical protein
MADDRATKLKAYNSGEAVMLGKRDVIGFALAPLPVLAPLLLAFAATLFTAPPDLADRLQAMIELVLMSYGTTLLIGLPVHLILRWKRRRSLAAYLSVTVTGVLLIGAAIAIGELLFPPSAPGNPHALRMLGSQGVMATLVFAVIASVSAWLFWIVAVRPRPI